MQNSRFIVLTGHLNEYPLPDLIGVLRHQRKTGRLLIDYPAAPGVFFFKDGDLVDAQMGALKGVQAVLVAAGQPDAPFNFNPLIEPSEQSINNPLQKVVMEMLGCWQDEVVLDVEAAREPKAIEGSAVASPPPADVIDLPLFERKELPAPAPTVSPALPAAVGNFPRTNNRRRLLTVACVLLLLASIPTSVALTGVLNRKPVPAPRPAKPRSPVAEAPAEPPKEDILGSTGFSDLASGESQTVEVDSGREKGRQRPRTQASRTGGAEREFARTNDGSAPTAEKRGAGASAAKESASAESPTVTIVTQVENGRVVQAYVANRRPGMEAYEASALRAARRRQYPPGTTGSEKVQVKIDKP